jgi:MoaA/NifB/PqqE/SkfB family radical SAM enzyme
MARLYSNMKFLRYGEQLAAVTARTSAAPVHVRIKPINLCNHDCWYCAYRAGDLALGETMDERARIPHDKMFEIVEDLVEMKVKAVTFSGGGEPLLYNILPGVIERLAAGGVKTAALTNGSNLRGAMADAFARHGSWIRVSLDAWDDASYSASRSAPDGAFTRLIDNLRAFSARGSSCVLGASFIISDKNAHRIAEVCAILKDAGVNHVKLSAAVVSNDGRDAAAYHRKIAESAVEQIAAAKKLQDEGFSIVDHYHELEERFDKDYRTCLFQQFLTVIGADCQVYSCQDKAYTPSGLLGSITDRRFKDFWFSDAARERLYGLDPSVDCRHHCVAHQKNLMLHEIISTNPEHACFV